MIRAIDPVSGNRNVLGGELSPCSIDPMTGFYRTGCCETGPDDQGSHTVCIMVTDSFLEFSRACGNDLSKVKSCIKLTGFVNSTEDFIEQPKVINGASDLIVSVFGI